MDFVATVADTIARLMEESERRHVESSLNIYQNRALELQRMEALGRLAAGIAHDFRNILTAINGYSELIAETAGGGSEIFALSQGLRDSAGKGQQLIEELLAYGHESASVPVVLDLVDVLKKFEKILRMAVGRSVQLNYELPQRVGRVLMDKSQLERSLLNLVMNARDAMPEGGTVTVTVREHVQRQTKKPSDEQYGSYAVLVVADNGAGMSEEIRQRIFEPFFTTKGKKGTGLGLAIVQQVVSRCGGHIEVESEPGKGTVFNLYLPMIAGASPDSGAGI